MLDLLDLLEVSYLAIEDDPDLLDPGGRPEQSPAGMGEWKTAITSQSHERAAKGEPVTWTQRTSTARCPTSPSWTAEQGA